MITVGGGAPVPVLLDTGSSGLVIDADAVGPATERGNQPDSRTYGSGSVSGVDGRAAVGLGTTTSAPVAALLVTSSSGTTTPPGTRGVLGIASTNVEQAADPDSAPLLSLPAPLGAGQTLTVSANGSVRWTLGAVAALPGTVSVPLAPSQSAQGSAPAAAASPATRWAKDVNLCWSGIPAGRCGATDLDSGSTDTGLNSTAPGAGTGPLASGTSVTVSAPQGPTLWSFTAGTSPSLDQVHWTSLGATTQFNTGIAFFVGRTIAWDYQNGRLLIGPANA